MKVGVVQSKTTYAFDGHFTPQDKTTSDYHYLPFDVPDGVTRIDVRYDFTRTGHAARKAGHENVIDIGLFDPRGHECNGAGFRGWSGSVRAEFFVGLSEATPGFLPGPIPAGTWQVILGLYRIAPEGCDYRVTVTLTRPSQPTQPLSSSATSPSPPSGVLRTGAGWYCGDLQTHTHHSDAEASVAELAGVARARGLDFLAVTDHNTVSHLPELAAHSGPDLLLIPGMEVTTYYGHANVWGLSRWIDFRCRDAGDVRRVIEAAHAQGALFSINHPKPTGPAWEYGWIEGIDAIEVWQAPWYIGNDGSLAWWEELLQAGRRIVAVGGSDRHQPRDFDPRFPYQVGTPTTWVYAENLSVEAILAGIQAGHVFITTNVNGPQVRLTARGANGQTAMMGDVLKVPVGTPVRLACEVNGAEGHVLEFVRDGQVLDRRTLKDDAAGATWRLPVERDGYVRAGVIASGSGSRPSDPAYPMVLALTNPIYVKAIKEKG